MKTSQAKINGWMYLVIGLLLVWLQWWIMSQYSREPYKGWNALQYIWGAFGMALIAVSVYILCNNK